MAWLSGSRLENTGREADKSIGGGLSAFYSARMVAPFQIPGMASLEKLSLKIGSSLIFWPLGQVP